MLRSPLAELHTTNASNTIADSENHLQGVVNHFILAVTSHQGDIYLAVLGAIHDNIVLLIVRWEKRCFVTHYNNVYIFFRGKNTKKTGQ